MPSKSRAQHNLMEAAAHDEAFSKTAGVPQTVANEFVAADKADNSYRGKGKVGASDAKARAGQRKTWQGK